jgi:Helicase associated domain
MFLKYREHIAQHIDAPNYIHANTKLRNWVNTQREWQRQGKLDPQRKKKLDEIGFVWLAQDGAWEEGFAALKSFKMREGHCRVKQSHSEGTFALGRWAHRQRQNRRKMSTQRRKLLDEIGFVWSTK